MSDEKDLPSIPSSIDSALRRPLEAMRESIQRLMGMRGADGRAAVRWDDLADEGLASLPRRRLLINQAIEQGATGGGSGGSGGSYVPDLTKPPTPAGLDGVGAITSILLSWTAPAYTVGHGHKQTNVYATKQAVSSSTLYTINDAVRVNTAPGAQTVLAHTSDPNLKWRIWIKFESVDGVESDPAGGINGFVVSTGQDVTHLLEVLTGQISTSQLAAALSNKITLIDEQRKWENSANVNGNDASLITAVLMDADGTTPLKNPDTLFGSSKGSVTYTVSARVSGTSTVTGAVSAFTVSWNGSAWVWTQKIVSEAGTSSNHVKLYLNSGVPSVRLYSHTSTYTVVYSVEADVGGYSAAAAIQTETSTRSSETGYIGSLYSVRTQLTAGGKTVIGGFGLMGTSAPGAGTTIDFGVSADKFWVGAPTGSTGVGDIQPFVVQTTDQTVNGVLIPKGVYMDAAYIKNLTAMVSRLGAAWIDSAMVASMSVSKLVSGSFAVGADAQSSNYSAGSTGWIIRGNGGAEFSNITIRGATYTGTIYANSGTIGGITIASTYMRAGQIGFDNGIGFYFGSDGRFSFGNSSGSKITWDNSTINISANLVGATGTFAGSLSAATGTFAGSLSAATGTFAGSLSAATGTFAGSLSAATGSFSGTLTASAVNAVDTINLAGNAVTVPVSANRGSGLSFGDWVDVLTTSSADFGGGAVTVIYTVDLTPAAGGNEGDYINLYLQRDGSTIRTWSFAAGRERFTDSWVDYPGSGSHTYKLRAYAWIYGVVHTATITALGVKR